MSGSYPLAAAPSKGLTAAPLNARQLFERAERKGRESLAANRRAHFRPGIVRVCARGVARFSGLPLPHGAAGVLSTSPGGRMFAADVGFSEADERGYYFDYARWWIGERLGDPNLDGQPAVLDGLAHWLATPKVSASSLLKRRTGTSRRDLGRAAGIRSGRIRRRLAARSRIRRKLAWEVGSRGRTVRDALRRLRAYAPSLATAYRWLREDGIPLVSAARKTNSHERCGVGNSFRSFDEERGGNGAKGRRAERGRTAERAEISPENESERRKEPRRALVKAFYDLGRAAETIALRLRVRVSVVESDLAALGLAG